MPPKQERATVHQRLLQTLLLQIVLSTHKAGIEYLFRVIRTVLEGVMPDVMV